MKNTIKYFKSITRTAIKKLYGLSNLELEIQYVIKKFPEDITIVIFPIVKITNKKLETIGNELGLYLKKNFDCFESFTLVKGFLNLKLISKFYINTLNYLITYFNSQSKKIINKNDLSVMIEFSSPNTNKPLHIGHIRNILLGDSISSLFKYVGKNVIKIQIFNDRGIHICKSMVAWHKFGKNTNPDILGIKSDHFVGKYYIKFYNTWNEEIKNLCSNGMQYDKAKEESKIMKCARKMLREWESGDINIINLWKKMNNWVYKGFIKTYERLGIKFDINQYESKTFILGKKIIEIGLRNKIFFKKEDGSVWIDLKEEKLGEKLLLRSDGTSVYITQDLGTVIERFENYSIDTLIYVVGKEQDYHFKVLLSILRRLQYTWVKNIFHLSYEMVSLPTGKMKSRYGSIIYADDLMDKIHNLFYSINKEKDFDVSEIISQAALKYHFLKIDPKKRIVFDIKKSLDFKGNTGVYIQYTYVRICSIKRKNLNIKIDIITNNDININKYERLIIATIEKFNIVIETSVNNLNPSLIANYAYELSKIFNDYYHNIVILKIKDKNYKTFRFNLAVLTGIVLKQCMKILGISLIEYM